MQTSSGQLRWEACGATQETATFRDRESVCLVAQWPTGSHADLVRVDFVIQARNPRGYRTPWRTVACLGDVPVDAHTGRAAVRWSLADVAPDSFERWAFATFRFTVRPRAALPNRLAPWSPQLRHHASVVGFYGFGPTGEFFANAELRRVARAVGGVVLRRRAAAALRRLAAQVPADSDVPIQIFGYSLGGYAAVRFARELQACGNVPVARLLLIDPVVLAGHPLLAPANVRRAVSYYQQNGGQWFFLIGRAGRGVPVLAESAAHTEVRNHLIALRPDGEPTMHEDVPRLTAGLLVAELRGEPSEPLVAALNRETENPSADTRLGPRAEILR